MVRTKLLLLACLLAFAATPVLSHAIPYKDVNGDHSGSVWMNGLLNPCETWTFDLDNDALALGNINPGDTIHSASLRIGITDDDPTDRHIWNLEFSRILVDGTTVYGSGLLGDEVDQGDMFFNVISWVSDHKLNVTIKDVLGSFRVDTMEVFGEYDSPLQDPVVPEPATMTLMGLGLSGLGLMTRRKLAKK